MNAAETEIKEAYQGRDQKKVLSKFRGLRNRAELYLRWQLFITKFQCNKLWAMGDFIIADSSMSQTKIKVHNSAGLHYTDALRKVFKYE